MTRLTGTLYSEAFERDSCGFGLVAQMDDRPSHWVVDTAINALHRLTHRGAVAPDGKTGDGCGILLKKPDAFLLQVAAEAGIRLTQPYAAGMVFLDTDEAVAHTERKALEAELDKRGLSVAGWRVVPTETEVCGEEALKTLPHIEQVFVTAPEETERAAFNRDLFIARRRADIALSEHEFYYVASLSTDVISYKGLVLPANLPRFFPDLRDERLVTSTCVFHQRFSTNTWPQWRLAQPFRYLAHNGEINTIQGNRNWARARTHRWQSELLPDLSELQPLVSMTGSDSCSLDNMLEVLLAGGMDVLQAMRLLVPPAWQNADDIDPDIRAFYEYFAMHQESWDGPAGIVLTDGRYAACSLDRNGLRPARYTITDDRHVIIASESGVIDIPDSRVTAKGRLKPGDMVAVDSASGKLLMPADIDHELMHRYPCKRWLKEQAGYVGSTFVDTAMADRPMDVDTLAVHEKMFQVTFEERDQVIRILAEGQQEAVGSMGDDTPLPALSKRERPLYDYFRQQFAQVTNPPIDPLRERIVMSLETQLGREGNIFDPQPELARRVIMGSPVLSERKFIKIKALAEEGWRNEEIDLNFPRDGRLSEAVTEIADRAEAAVRDGAQIVILSDRDIGPDRLPVHALMATGAVHHRLVDAGLRCDANIVVETATTRDPHHFACLIAYGATAIFPYLAYQSLFDLTRTGQLEAEAFSPRELGRAYRRGIKKGLFKIMSKMGISTVASYRGSQLYEIVGLDDEVVEECFAGTTSRLGGAGYAELEKDLRTLAGLAWDKRLTTDQGGLLKYIDGGEYHAYHPDVIRTLQNAVRSGDYEDYKTYARVVNEREPMVFRDLLDFRRDRKAVDIDEVEPIENILPRFDTAAMSLGALSPEAHEALAIAMNRIGGRSNSGEGGEDSDRYGTERVSKIKQIASGRFGVTPEYLVNAEVLQIKMAQGAKPGEGGQLPGHKVNEMIARLRFARPGVALISPPPHHDIYSIEDLAQLIFDLKQVNPDALVSVKLVSEPGVGTVAAGVAKAYADLITIAGYDGGTGASPLTSLKYAGSPWELGLSEAHQTLRANDLRDKVRLQTDGGLKTGLDVVKGAILGAESFGFGTAPMVALGCTYLRICHLNNCATGLATQEDSLRKVFRGTPEMAINYFCFVAQEAREIMADLGVKRLEDLIGRTDLLERIEGVTDKQNKLDLSPILSQGELADDVPRFCLEPKNEPFDKGELAERMVRETLDAIENRRGGEFHYEVRNFNRSIGARLSGEIAKRYGNYGMEDTPITLRLRGTAGQSFGAWNAGGLHMHLEGDANDYVGKGMAAGKLVLVPPGERGYHASQSSIMGNTCLYGATGGSLFACGQAGERFAVRNSGAVAVVEGLGDHGCEYMTGGVVVVLGPTGVNFGAGMTGGFAYVLDEDRLFVDRYNHELIDINRISLEYQEQHVHHLRELIEEHLVETGSERAAEILDDFRSYIGRFWLVKPKAEDIESLLETLRQAA